MFLAAPAAAQHSQYLFPVERGVLESHVDLQYQYASFNERSTSILSLEGQFELGSRFELGVNVPFIVTDNAALGHQFTDDLEFGDLIVASKVSLLDIGRKLGLAAYLNLTLPTHSGAGSHDWVVLQGGAVVEAGLLGFRLGGGAQVIDVIRGDYDDIVLLGLNGFARFPLPVLPFLALQFALEYFNSLAPDGDLNAFLLTPGIELSFAVFHLGFSARVAVSDEARLISGGRAAFMFNAGVRF